MTMSHRPYDLVILDLDGVLVVTSEPIWKTLHEACGSDHARRTDVIRRVRAGELTYAQWFAEDLAMLTEAGADRAAIAAVLGGLAVAPGARELVEGLRAAGVRVAIMSGGVDLTVELLLPGLEVDALFANRIEFDAAGHIVGGRPTPYDEGAKEAGLRHLCERFGVPASRVAFVGDGPNDVAIARAAGFAVAWGLAPDAALVAASDTHVAGSDLRELLPLLLE